MATIFDEVIHLKGEGLEVQGLLKRRNSSPDQLPLVVFIHGGGSNAGYFCNSSYSYPRTLSKIGHNVLNIQRAGYGGVPLPTTPSPLIDAVPLITKLIANVRDAAQEGQGGVILVGHSMGAAIALAIAAQSMPPFPVLGVSALGAVPSPEKGSLLPDPDPAPNEPRYVIEDVPTVIETFFGPFECLNEDVFTGDILKAVFEPAVRSDCREFAGPVWYHRFIDEIFPSIKVPVQYLASEFDLFWHGVSDAQPRFDQFVKLFSSSPSVEAKLLRGGGHNYEFSKNSQELHSLRYQFISRMSKENAPSSSITSSFASIPVLNFPDALSSTTKQAFLAHLREALVNVGFLYLQNPPVSTDTQKLLSEKAYELFNLPLEKKLEIEMVNSKHFLGYSRLGAEITALKSDHREQFDFATELPAPGPEEPLYRNIYGPNQWPDETAIPRFREAVEKYIAEITALSGKFTALIAEALDLPANAFDEAFDNPQQHKLKLIKYPPPPDHAEKTGSQGVGPHKDSGFLTFLMQASPQHGLEVQNKAGEWISAPPVPNTFVINIGRALEAMTGGVCTATTHRVSLRKENFIDPEGNALGPRFSFPVFQGVSPDLSAEKITLVMPQHIRDLVKDAKVKSDAEATFNGMFKTNIGEGTLVARITSHQDVGQRWYPEILARALQGQKEYTS